MGWIGETKKLAAALDAAGVDKTPGGEVLFKGSPAWFGLGGAEIVVQDDAEVFIKGEAKLVVDIIAETDDIGGCFVAVL